MDKRDPLAPTGESEADVIHSTSFRGAADESARKRDPGARAPE